LRNDLAGNAAWALLDFRQQVEFILRTIEIINNTRSSLFKAKAQQVLIAKSKYPLQTKDIIMAKKKDPTAALINQYTVFALKAAYSDLVEEYAQLVGVNTLGETQTAAETVEVEVLPPEIFQLPTFFKNASENTGNQTQSEIVQALARTKAHYFVDKTLAPVIEVLRDNVVKPIIQAIEKESQKQKESFERIQQELEQLKAKNQILIEQSLSKQRRKEALSKRVKRAPRAAITLEDYDTAQTLANSPNKIAQASDKIALCLLFLTGLRISNLRLITVGDLERFYMGSDLSVCLIKTKNGVNITYPYNKAYRHYLRQLKPEFTLFFSQKADKLRPAWDIARETLTRRINKILKKTSVVVGKNIKSHSFRIALCTEVTEAFTIRHAQQILGHANIATTERYARGTLKKQDKIKILMNVRNPIKKLRSRQEQDLDEFEESEADE
jgi:integrase